MTNNHIPSHLLLSGIILWLPSCVATDGRDAQIGAIVIPARWQHSPVSSKPLDTASLAMWWKQFHDPVLNELVEVALGSSTDVRTALSRIAEYRARRDVEKAALIPQLTGNASGTGARASNRTTHVTTASESYHASLDASWQVDLFGRQAQTLKAASEDLAQNEEKFYGAQVSLAAEVATAYVALRSAEAELVVVRRSLGTRHETVQLTQWREQSGAGSGLDTQQSISAFEQARASIPELQLTIAQTRNQLTRLSGRLPASLDSLLAKPRSVPKARLEIAVGIPAEALRRRPDVRAAEHQVAAAFARTNAAKRERLPSLSLNGSLGLEALRAGRLFSPETTVASVLGSLATPLVDAGRIRNHVAIQSELEKQSVIAYEAIVLTAVSEGENALIAIQRYNEKLDILAKAIVAAREAATLSGIQYQAGQVSLLVSLDTQRTLLTLEDQNVIATAQRANACIQLYKALGGGWSHP